MPRSVCGRCYYDRNRAVDLVPLTSKETKKVTMYCPFCDEERHPGGKRLRVHIAPDIGKGSLENVLEIPHIKLI